MMTLEDDFNTETLTLQNDYEGAVVATLISAKANKAGQKSVLYIHGFVDYFFQVDMAEVFVDGGYNFYALDLRKYGRSILPHQHPNYCRDIHEYYEEISASIREIKAQSGEGVYLFGHSTGGLIATNYMVDGEEREKISGLLLNSPFLEIKFPLFLKRMLYSITSFVGNLVPYSSLPKMLSPAYAESLHKDFKGEWDFNLAWKPIEGFVSYYVWLSAIIRAQYSLVNPNIKVPILILHSEVSRDINVYTDEVKTADIVLRVEDMKNVGVQLGADVTLVSIKGGMHDLVLSVSEVRNHVYAEIFKWLKVH